jgi:hypothetical protein
MSTTLQALSREVTSLKQALLAALASGQVAPPGGLVSLKVFAAAVGRSPKTLMNQAKPGPGGRHQWPKFWRAAGGAWVTTETEIRVWFNQHCQPVGAAPEVEAALNRHLPRKGRRQ